MNKTYKVEMELTFGEMVALVISAATASRIVGGMDSGSRLGANIRGGGSSLRIACANALAGRFGALDPEWDKYWGVVCKWDEGVAEDCHHLYDCGRRIAAARKEVA